MKTLIWLLACAGLLLSFGARAERFEGLLPENPTPDSEIQVKLWFSGGCYRPSTSLTFDELSVAGSVIRAVYDTRRLPASLAGCGNTAAGIYTYTLGKFPAGNYTLELITRETNLTSQALTPIASVPLVISGSTQQQQLISVPVNNAWVLGVLAFALMLFGLSRTSLWAK